MTVVHVAEAFGGGIVEFIRLLVKFQANNTHIIIYGEREINIEDIKPTFEKNATFILWKNAKRNINLLNDWQAFLELIYHLKTIDFYDVLHLHSSKAGFIGRLVGFTFNIKNIYYTPNGLSFEMKDISRTKKYFYITIEYIANLMSGKVVCVSKSEVESLNKIGVKASLINNGIDVSIYKDKLKLNNKNPIIFTVGRITEQKNPFLFNKIAEHFSNIEFIWVGDGNHDNKALLFSKNINIIGWLSKEDLISFLQNDNLIYLSTALWEGLPFAVIESMLFKNAMVVSNCVGNIDLVEHNKNGFVYDSYDEGIKFIDDLLYNSDIRIRFGEESHIRVYKYFNAEDMSNKYNSVYKLGSTIY